MPQKEYNEQKLQSNKFQQLNVNSLAIGVVMVSLLLTLNIFHTLL